MVGRDHDRRCGRRGRPPRGRARAPPPPGRRRPGCRRRAARGARAPPAPSGRRPWFDLGDPGLVAARRLGDGAVRSEPRVEGRLGIVGKVRLPEVEVGEEAPVLVPAAASRAATLRNTSPRLPWSRNTSWNSAKPRSKPKPRARHRVGHEAGGVHAARGQHLGQGQAVLRQASGERDLAVVAVGVLRGPDRGHGAQGVDGRGERVLEHDAFAGQSVDLRRGGPRVAVGRERAGAAPRRGSRSTTFAPARERPQGRRPSRPPPAASGGGGRRLRRSTAQDARAPPTCPRRSGRCPARAAPTRQAERARCRPPGRAGARPTSAGSLRRGEHAPGNTARASPPPASIVSTLQRRARRGRRAAGWSAGVKRSSAAGAAGGRSERRWGPRGEGGHAAVLDHREGPGRRRAPAGRPGPGRPPARPRGRRTRRRGAAGRGSSDRGRRARRRPRSGSAGGCPRRAAPARADRRR